MDAKTKERVYLLVVVFCLLMCAVLIANMLVGKPQGDSGLSSGGGNTHIPPRQLDMSEVDTQAPNKDHMMISEEYFSQMLTQYLPKGFPAAEIKTDIAESGKVTLTATMQKEDIQAFLEAQGMAFSTQQNLLFMLLPQVFDFEGIFQCSTGEDGGLLLVVPESISLNGSAIEIAQIPSSILDSIGTAANALLVGTEYYFTEISFIDGAIKLSAG